MQGQPSLSPTGHLETEGGVTGLTGANVHVVNIIFSFETESLKRKENLNFIYFTATEI